MMHSYIFSSDAIRGYRRLPIIENGWHLLLGISGIICLALCSVLLRLTFTPWPEPSVHKMAHASISEHTEVVFLGASLVRADINPDYFQREIVNLSVDGGDYQSAELLLRHNINRMPNLKLAVIEIDNLVQFYNRLAVQDLTSLFEQGVPLHSIPNLSLWDRLLQWLKNNALMQPIFFLDRLTPKNLLYRDRQLTGQKRPGHSTLLTAMNEKELSRRNLNQDEALLSSPSRKANWSALFNLIETLRENNVPFVLLRFPQIRQYQETKSDAFNNAYDELLASVKERYGPELRYWDYIHAPKIDLNDFSDTRHLNVEGARIFSQLLSERLEVEFFRSPRPASTGDHSNE